MLYISISIFWFRLMLQIISYKSILSLKINFLKAKFDNFFSRITFDAFTRWIFISLFTMFINISNLMHATSWYDSGKLDRIYLFCIVFMYLLNCSNAEKWFEIEWRWMKWTSFASTLKLSKIGFSHLQMMSSFCSWSQFVDRNSRKMNVLQRMFVSS